MMDEAMFGVSVILDKRRINNNTLTSCRVCVCLDFLRLLCK